MSKRTRRQPIPQPLQWMKQPFTAHEPEYNPEIEPKPLRTGLIWLSAAHPKSFCAVLMALFGIAGLGSLVAALMLHSGIVGLIAGLLLLLALLVPAFWVLMIRRLAGLPAPVVLPAPYRWAQHRQAPVRLEYAPPTKKSRERQNRRPRARSSRRLLTLRSSTVGALRRLTSIFSEKRT